MRKLLLIAGAGAVLLAGGCATSGGYAGGGVGFGYNYNGPSDVWYDGYYGPYTDGYWNDGGAFFFRGGDGHYYRDQADHFRTQSFVGSQQFAAKHRHR